MSVRSYIVATAMVTGLAFGSALPVFANSPGETGYGWGSGYCGCPGMMGQDMGSGMMMGQGMMGQGMMGPGKMGQGMMGQGMMGQGMMGQGMMGQGKMGQGMMAALPTDLSVDVVRHMLEHQLTSQGNPNLKLGKVEEKDADTIVAEIVTTNGSLVQRFQVNRHTGWMQPVQ
jgi:hypothetical protein